MQQFTASVPGLKERHGGLGHYYPDEKMEVTGDD